MSRAPVKPIVPPMRLAVLSYGLPVPGQKRGGIERAAHTLAEGLARRGHRVVVFSHDPRPPGASYEVRELPWKRFVNTWFGRRVTMGYLGNLLALVPDYGDFDAVIAHGDSLLLPLRGKPVVRIMHGSALGEARSARSPGRFVLQFGVYLQELATALVERGTVAVSESARRDNGFVRRVIPHGVDSAIFFPEPSGKTREPSVLFVGALDGRKRGRFLLDLFQRFVRAAHPDCVAGHGRAGRAARGRRDVPHRRQRRGTGRAVSPRLGVRLAQHVPRDSVCRISKRWRAGRRCWRRRTRGAVKCCKKAAAAVLPPMTRLPARWWRCSATARHDGPSRSKGCNGPGSSRSTR